MSGYGVRVKTPPDTAAIAAAKAEAEAEIKRLSQIDQEADATRARRDAAIRKMNDAGRPVADIARDLKLPVSTVRQSIKMAIVRAAS